MNKIPVVLVLLLLVAGVGAYLLWSGEEPDLRPDAAITTADKNADSSSQAAGETAEAAGVDVEAAAEVIPDDFLRTEVKAEAEPGRPIVVQVWRGKKGVPAPDTDVFLLDDVEERGFDWDDLKGEFAPHWSVVAEERGARYRTDGNGRVDVPQVRGGAVAAAKSDGLYGFVWIQEEGKGPPTIVLRPDETVTVRVVDGEGKAVTGVPVGIVQRVPVRSEREELFAKMRELEQGMRKAEQWMQNNPGQREAVTQKVVAMRNQLNRVRREVGRADGGPRARGDGRARAERAVRAAAAKKQQQQQREYETRHELRARRLTDENGLAVFRHFQVYRSKGGKWWPKEHVDRFQAVLLMPLAQPSAREFTGRPVSEDVIELRMPATASLALRTVDRDGRPFTHPVHAQLRLDSPDAVPWSRLQVRKEQNEEAIVFPFVGLGLRFTAQCRLDDEDFRWRMSAFAGPIEPGEHRVVDLVVAPGEGMLHGRLVDVGGKAIADEEVTFLINTLAGRLEGEEVLLDKNGRFHLPYQARPHHRPPFRLQIRRPGVVPIAGLSMPLESLPREHVTDLGELRLDGLGAVAQGVVVDDRGQPIPGAWLQLRRERNVGREQVRMEFTDEAFAHAETDEDGHFALFGELERARYQLLVEAENHFEEVTPDVRPGEPMRIELLRKSRLLGTVLRPDWLLAKNVRASLVPVFDPEEDREDQIHDFKGKAYTYFDWVRPGVYDLSLRVSQFPDPFLRIDGLIIEPGQMDLHPRIRDIDLGAYLYRYEIFAVDENGQPLQLRRPLLARIQRPDGSSGHIGLPWQKGRVEMISTSPQAEVIPMAPGYVTEATSVVAGRSEIRFLAIPPVELQLTGMKALAGTTNVQVILEMLDTEGLPAELVAFDGLSRRIAGWYARARFSAAMVGDDDIARLQVMRPGPHKVTLRFGAGQGIRPSAVELQPIEVELKPGAGPSRIVASYDLQIVQNAITEAAQKISQAGQGGK